MVLLISTCPVGLVCHCLQAVLKPLFLSEIMYATIYAGSSLIYASLACWMRSQSRELPVWTFQNSLCSVFTPLPAVLLGGAWSPECLVILCQGVADAPDSCRGVLDRPS